MDNIYQHAVKKVSDGYKFSVNFKTRSLKLGGRYIIRNGAFDGNLGIDTADHTIGRIERLYRIYRHSIPSEQSENKCFRYFQALPEKELSDEDMMFGERRDVAQIALELFVLAAILQGSLSWDMIAPNKWFWQSSAHPSLILLRDWIIDNKATNKSTNSNHTTSNLNQYV